MSAPCTGEGWNEAPSFETMALEHLRELREKAASGETADRYAYRCACETFVNALTTTPSSPASRQEVIDDATEVHVHLLRELREHLADSDAPTRGALGAAIAALTASRLSGEDVVGKRVRKIKGLPFGNGDAVVVADYEARGGRRLVVQHPEGWQHIFSPDQVEIAEAAIAAMPTPLDAGEATDAE